MTRLHATRRATSKHRNIPCSYDGRRFASQGEGGRYLLLKSLETLGDIKDLRCQVTYSLDVNGVHICKYRADFVYIDHRGLEVVEDFKGQRLAEYRIKARLMLACHGITILETTAPPRRRRR